jgi:hypothetical protein
MSAPHSYLFNQPNTLHFIKAGLEVFTVTVRAKKIRIDSSLLRYYTTRVLCDYMSIRLGTTL